MKSSFQRNAERFAKLQAKLQLVLEKLAGK
jgi:hypothetical protein